MNKLSEGVYRVIKTVASPLHFFAVSAVILGVLIVVLASKSILPPDVTLWLIVIAFSLLVFLIIIVTILVIFFPKKLTFDKEAHLTLLREQLGDNELPTPYVPGTVPNISAPDIISSKE